MTTTSLKKQSRQLTFPGLALLQPEIDLLAGAGVEMRGAVYTRREVVEFILDLVGYTPDQPLHTFRLLEPSFGSGDFLLVAIERLLTAYQAASPPSVEALQDAVRAVELHTVSYQNTRQQLAALLPQYGFSDTDIETLLNHWLIQGDFLLESLPFDFTHIVGNPPYVRQELIPDALLAEYRRQYTTLFDRADLYIPFIEKSLELLAPRGELGFICSDRWMKNRYGAPLRELVSGRFHLKYYVDMVDTPAFHDEVTAYPAITVISREKPDATRIAVRPQIDPETLSQLSRELRRKGTRPRQGVQVVRGIVQGQEPWILHASDQLALMRRLEEDFSTLEEAGCAVGIGVATGADQVFIRPYDELEVESDRKLPLVMTKDICSGTVQWQGLGVINPFTEDGSLADLQHHPRLAAYLQRHETLIRKRHVAQKNPDRWYRTIDRIYPVLAQEPKLLIPDIKGEPHIVYEEGRFYPHHNLYYITSDEWDLPALQAVLMSGIARLFISTYSTRMRGGYLRYQAQYLRRIRIPTWDSVPPQVRDELKQAAQQQTLAACNEAVFDLYQLSAEERDLLRIHQ